MHSDPLLDSKLHPPWIYHKVYTSIGRPQHYNPYDHGAEGEEKKEMAEKEGSGREEKKEMAEKGRSGIGKRG